MHRLLTGLALLACAPLALAQVPPSEAEVRAYAGPARRGRCRATSPRSSGCSRRAPTAKRATATGARRCTWPSTARSTTRRALLLAKGANANALDRQRYDVVTIAAVADDVPMLKLVLEGGASAKNVTSPYDGTALIAAAHLGHVEVVQMLIKAGAPLDHVNNLTWTALMESIVLGDGGKRHTETLRALVQAGANVNLPDRAGITPLAHARGRGYKEMAQILEKAGAR